MISHIHSALEFSAQVPRYTEILRVLFKYGFSDVLKLFVLQRIMGIEASEMPTHDSGLLAKPPEERLRLALEELGPTFIKFREDRLFLCRWFFGATLDGGCFFGCEAVRVCCHIHNLEQRMPGRYA